MTMMQERSVNFFNHFHIYKQQRTEYHCCYQGDFQEVNILVNGAHLVNVKFILTESSYEKIIYQKL